MGNTKGTTIFAGTSDIACVLVREDLGCQEPRRVVRRSDVVPLSMTHLTKLISKLFCLLSLITLVPSLTRLEEIA